MALKNSSVAVQIDKTLTRHLDVLIHPPMSNDVGWDVFSLTYTLETDSFSLPGDNGQPLEMKSVVSTVLTADVRTVYLRLFRYVWWIRRLDFSLNRMWHQDTVLYRLIASSARPSTARLLSTGGSSAAAKDRLMNSELQKLVDEIGMTQMTQLMYRTRMEMAHFVHQLQFYVLFDTMNAAWLRLEQFIRSGDGDLDEFIAVHRQYLSELSAYALFNCGGAEKVWFLLINFFPFVSQNGLKRVQCWEW
jgi:hypothetical protein